MVVATILTMLLGAAIVIGGRPLWAQGQRREAAVYLMLLLCAYALSVLLALGVRLPYITTALWRIVHHMVHYSS